MTEPFADEARLRAGWSAYQLGHGRPMTELIVGYDCRVYAHVDTERGSVVRVVVDEGTLADPTLVDGPPQLEREALAIAEVWPAWSFGP